MKGIINRYLKKHYGIELKDIHRIRKHLTNYALLLMIMSIFKDYLESSDREIPLKEEVQIRKILGIEYER